MKILSFIILLGSLFFCSGCHDVTVGYLYADEAEYPVKTLEIYNIPDRIAALQAKLDAFKEQSPALQEEYDRCNGVYLEQKTALDEYQTEVVYPARDSVEKILQEGVDDVKIAEIKKRLEEVILPHQEELADALENAQAALNRAENAINELADRLGMESPVIVAEEIAALKERIFYEIPWTTSVMEGIQGTEPLVYELEEVKNENPENAALFRKYLTVMGGGRLYVKLEVDVPAGEYVVSVRVSNEGRTSVFEDAFTFVVTK